MSLLTEAEDNHVIPEEIETFTVHGEIFTTYSRAEKFSLLMYILEESTLSALQKQALVEFVQDYS